MPGVHRGKQKALDVSELEFWMVVSLHMGTGNGTQVLCKGTKF